MGLQTLIVFASAVFAAAFLVWHLARPFLSQSASTGCHGCTAACDPETQPGLRAEPGRAIPLKLVRRPREADLPTVKNRR